MDSEEGEGVAASTVLDGVGVAVLAVEDGVVSYANQAATALLGTDRDRLEDTPLEALTPDDADAGDRIEGAADGTGGRVDLAFAPSGGTPTPVTASVRRLDDGGGERHVLALEARREAPERERAAGEEGRLYEKLFAHSNDAIVVLDPGRDEIVDCNPRACELLGYDREELLSVAPTEIHPDEVERFRQFVSEVVDEGAGWTNQLHCYTKRGEQVPAEISAAAVDLDGRTHVLASIRDLSQRQERERALADLHEVTRDLMEAETVDAITARAVEAGRRIIDLPLAHVYLLDEAGDRLEPAAASPEMRDRLDDLPTFERGEGLLWEALEEGSPRLYDDVQAEGDLHSDVPFRSAILVPLGDRGVFGYASTEAGQFDGFDVDMAAILAAQTEAALDRAARERRLRERSAAMDAALDGIAITDADGVLRYANGAFAAVHGYDDADALVGGDWRQLYDEDRVDRFEWDILPTVREEGQWRGEAVGLRADGSTFPESLTVSRTDDGGMVWVVRDVTDRRAQLRRLEALNETSRALIGESDPEAIADVAVEAVADVLEFDAACVRLYDADADALERAALTEGARELVAERVAYDLEATLAGRAYRQGEVVVDEPGGDDPYADAGLGSLHLPLGDRGVLTVVAEEGPFDDRRLRLAELLAGNVRSALARGERQRALRERERELRTRSDQLETLDRVNALVREIIGSLVEASTREHIERTVCERLVDSALYRSAWTADVDDEAVVARVGRSDDGAVPDAGSTVDPTWLGGSSAVEAADAGEVAVLRRYHDHPDDDADGEFVAVAAVPLTYGERTFGVLVVHAGEEGGFGERALEAFEVLGETVGFAINAARNRELLLSNRVVEVECRIEGVFAELSEELDCRFVHEGDVPTDEETVLHYVRGEGADPDAVVDHLEARDRVENVRVISAGAGRCRLEVDVRESPPELLVRSGATIRSIVAEDGESRLVAEAPPTADVRAVIEAIEEHYPDTELVAKREVERTLDDGGQFGDAVERALTDRQLTALRTAYRAGYYEWPRDSTAEEVATALDISSSTLHQHLRRAEAELLDAFFEDGG